MTVPRGNAASRLTKHAIARYRERVRKIATKDARRELEFCLLDASPRHIRKLKRGKKTVLIPTGCCFFVGSRGAIVTAYERPRRAP